MFADDARIEYGKKKTHISEDERAELKAVNDEIAANLAGNIAKAKEKRARRKAKEDNSL